MVEMQPFALVVAAALAGVHLLPGGVGVWLAERERHWESFAGGIGISYVLVHLLPEVHEVSEAAGEEAAPLGWLLGRDVWLLVLAGLLGFYLLEDRLLRETTPRARAAETAGDDESERSGGVTGSHDGSGERNDDAGRLFWLSLGTFAVYNAITAYTLMHPEMVGAESPPGPTAYALFLVAIGLHFYANDTEFRSRHGVVYRRVGRFVLAGGVAAGTVLGILVSIDAAVGVVFALVAGGLLLTVLRREVPGHAESYPGLLVLGAGAYAALLQLL